MDEGAERVSDADRDEAVETLREHLVAGRLTLDEFGDRVETALRAQARADLVQVQVDLPAQQPAGSSVRRRRPVRLTFALFAHVVRRGRLLLRRRSFAASIFSDVDLDLRDASVVGDRSFLWVIALFGNVDVYVPEEVDVPVSGVAVFGHRRDWGDELDRPWSPTVSVRIIGIFGTVDVWRVPRQMRGDYRQIIKQLRHPERALTADARGAPDEP
jgi:hypothetical protein